MKEINNTQNTRVFNTFFCMAVNLNKRKILFVGGGSVAARKLKTVLAFKPEITVISKGFSNEIKELSASKKIKIIEKAIEENDINDSFDFAFICTNDKETNSRISRICKEKNILINVADSPKDCDFFMPATIVNDDFTIAISTKGKNPSLSKKIKEKLTEFCIHKFKNI